MDLSRLTQMSHTKRSREVEIEEAAKRWKQVDSEEKQILVVVGHQLGPIELGPSTNETRPAEAAVEDDESEDESEDELDATLVKEFPNELPGGKTLRLAIIGYAD